VRQYLRGLACSPVPHRPDLKPVSDSYVSGSASTPEAREGEHRGQAMAVLRTGGG